MRNIPLTKPVFDGREIEMVKKCLDSGWVTQGPIVAEFEQRFASLHKVKYAFAVNSCTSALHLAALAIGLGPNDEAIVPAFTWVTSANCIEYTGAKAVFADVDPCSFNIDPSEIEKKITANTKAILPVHLFGLSAPMGDIIRIARKYGLKIIEDAACALGSRFKNKHVGTIGDIGCFSFHPRKVITTGEGGMVITDNEILAKKISSLRNHGATGPNKDIPIDKPYSMATFNNLGYNYRLSDILGAIGIAQMEKLDNLLNERQFLAQQYIELLKNVDEIALPGVPPKCHHTFQSFVIRVHHGGVSRRNSIMDTLASRGIETRPGTHAVHRLGYYANKYKLSPSEFPIASLCEDTSITLPIFSGMTQKNQLDVVNGLKQGLK